MKDVWQMIDDDTELDRVNRTKVRRRPFLPENHMEMQANALKEMLPALTAESLANAKPPGELTEKEATGLTAEQRELLSNLAALLLADEERDPDALMVRQAYRLTAKKYTSLTMRDVVSWLDEASENFTAESLANAKPPGELTEKEATGLTAEQRELLSNLAALLLADEERDPDALMVRQAYRLTAKKYTSLTMRDVVSWLDETSENFSSAF